MSHEYEAAECLEGIVDNAERIESYIGTMDRLDAERDGRTWDAAERCPERIWETVIRADDRAEQPMPGHPWGDIRATGSRPRRAGNRLNLDIVWSTAVERVPALGPDARGTS